MRDWNHSSDHRTASVLQALSGAVLAATPWVLGFADQAAALGAAVTFGLAALAVGIWGGLAPREWQPWTSVVVGLLAALSPWYLGFEHRPEAAWSLVGVAIAVIGFAGAQIAFVMEARDAEAA
jgi:drug/metabolite transporter (DMT)-like permease